MNIYALYAARPQPFGPRGAPSSIIKQPVATLSVGVDGTGQDEQGNKKLHGGPEKVLHQYSFEGYRALQAAFPQGYFHAGMIGENLLVAGMHDDNVYIGDIYQLGQVVVQVSAPRAPCNKISQRFGIKNLDRWVGQHGKTGWYYRVLKPGALYTGDAVTLQERSRQSVSVAQLMQAVTRPELGATAALYSELAVLDDEWREKCARNAARQSPS